MLTWFKNQFTPDVKTYNPDRSFVVSGVSRWRMCKCISQIPGVAFTRRPWLLGSSAKPIGEFTFRNVAFQIDYAADTGGDGLWVDELPHLAELRDIREHLNKSLAQ